MLILVAVVLLLVLPGPWNIVGFVVVTLLWFGELFLWSRTVKRKRRVVGAETLIGQIADSDRGVPPRSDRSGWTERRGRRTVRPARIATTACASSGETS